MKFLLATHAVIALIKAHPGFQARLKRHQPQDFGIAAIVANEVFYGAHKGSRTTQNLARLAALQFETVDFNRDDARQAGEIRPTLAAAGTPIDPYDVLLAGQALARSLTLITHNTREFERVPGLLGQDWE